MVEALGISRADVRACIEKKKKIRKEQTWFFQRSDTLLAN